MAQKLPNEPPTAKRPPPPPVPPRKRKDTDDKGFLLAVKEYIETAEQLIDADRGLGRFLKELIAEGEMPPLYAEVLRRIDGA